MQVFPDLRGLAYPVSKAPLYNTTVQVAVSGKEIRFGCQAMPRLTFQLSFNFLTKIDYESLLAFYHQHRGQQKPFLFLDKTDNEVMGSNIGVGNGIITHFQLYSRFGQVQYPIHYPINIHGIELSGEPTAAYTLLPGGIIAFHQAPSEGAIISASFTYFYEVRFQGETDYEKFSHELWQLKTLELITVK